MKKIVLLWILALFSIGLMGQTTVTIGNTGSSNEQAPPFGMDIPYERSASLYTHTELATNSGLIIQLGWNVFTSDYNSCPSKIYLKLTSSTTLTGVPWTSMTNGATLVYNAPAGFTTTGWHTVDIAGFVYSTTTSNLLVLCETNFGVNVAYSTPDFQFTTTTQNQHELWADVSPPAGNGTPNKYRPNIQITYYTPLSSVIPPSGFMAVAQSSSQVNLNWFKNSANDNVMVAFNTVNTFGTPTGTYVAGNTITGGGTVIYNGSGTTFSQVSGLSPNTTYYYRAWSFHSSNSTYSSGTSSVATTFCENLTVYPDVTDFETETFPPSCWSSASIPWELDTLASSHGVGHASVKADFFYVYPGNFDLISPELDLSTMSYPAIKFDYAYACDTTTHFNQDDRLELWSSTDNGATFTLINTWLGGLYGPLNTGGTMTIPFVPAANQWSTKKSVLSSATNKIMMRGVSYQGNNLYLDNITIYDTTFNWNGIHSENWNDPQNWTPNSVPNQFQDVSIPSASGTPHNPKISTTGLECKQLILKTGAILILNAGSGLTIHSNLIIQNGATLTNNGVLTIKGNLINLN